MAFTSSAIWEVQVTGNDANGGGFDPGVAGFSTDGTVDSNTGNTAAPVFSTVSYSFAASDVGAWVYIKAGTNSIPGWYKIVSVAGGKATLNASIGQAVLANGTPSTVVGLATVGTPTGLTWGVDYSRSGTAPFTSSTFGIGGTNTFLTDGTNTIGKNWIGNVIRITGGTGFTAQRVAVVSTSGTTATCDKSLGTTGSSGGTGNLGGAFLSPALPFSVAIASNRVWIKSGTYLMTSTSTNAANGVIDITAAALIQLEGYSTTRGDRISPPVLTASGISSVTLVRMAVGGADSTIVNIATDGSNLTAISGFSLHRGFGYLLSATRCPAGGFLVTGNNPRLVACRSFANGTVGFLGVFVCHACVAYDNTGPGFSGLVSAYHCIAYNNSGASSDGFFNTGNCTSCVAYLNGRHGFNTTTVYSTFDNCISESNAGTGFLSAGFQGILLLNCGAYSNGTNYNSTILPFLTINCFTLTASAFINAAARNFALNANVGGGAVLRGAGLLGLTPDGLSLGYEDVGAIQSKALSFIGANFEGGMGT